MAPKNQSYTCLHEEQIQEHSLRIAELSTKSEYKEQSIMELKQELKNINDKIDALSENVNTLVLNSESKDIKIDKRVEKLETKIELYEQFFKELKGDNQKRNNMQLALYALIVSVLALIANTLFHFI
jgi:chromosome segregation ATPase